MTGIILAGGKSTRMGSEKGLIPFRGKPMIEYSVEVLGPFCDEILISANTSSFDYLGFTVVKDIFPHCGPMGGIYSGLMSSSSDLNFVLSCDVPLTDKNIVPALFRKAKDCDIAVPWHGDDLYEPLCAIYHRNTLSVMKRFIEAGDFKLPNMFKKVNVCKIGIGSGSGLDAEQFFNVNTREQLSELENKTVEEITDKPGDGASQVKKMPNLLVIAGAGRNTGKTTLACAIIRQISRQREVVAVKISPHDHRQGKQQKIIVKNTRYLIIEETDGNTSKDSSRMLRAGAHKVYYIQSSDRRVEIPFDKLTELILPGTPVVCESGALPGHVKPGLFLMLSRKGEPLFKKNTRRLLYAPDKRIVFDGKDFDMDIRKICFDNGKWYVN